jgi:hypothetical protein
VSAESVAPPRPNLVIIGVIWGTVVGFLLTLLGTIALVAISFLTTPDIDDELAGYLLYVLPAFACGIAFLPMVIGSAMVGLGLGVFYQRQPQRLAGFTPVLIGVGVAVVVFILLFGLVYYFLGGSPLTEAGNVSVQTNLEIAAWVSPFLVLMMLGFGWLSNMLNKRIP